MRTFIAIDVPQEVKDEIVAAQKQLSSLVAAAAKMSLVKDFHLTLKFLGEITPANVEAVKNCLGSIRFRVFSAAVAGVGIFPSENYIRVVWAGIEPEDGFIRLQKLIDTALEKEFPKDKDFKPHLTLARIKFVSDKELFKRQLHQVKIKEVKFSVDSFKLKRSTLSMGGAVYDELASYSASN